MAETNIKDVKLKIGTETQFQSKLKDLPINTLVGTTDPIQEGELDTSIITKLNKAENALPKPTNDTTGSAGQVLKKTANGSEWGDAPSGGGKLYLHSVSTYAPTNDKAFIISALSTKSTQYLDFNEMYNDNFFPGQVKVENQGTVYSAGYFTKAVIGNEKIFRFEAPTSTIVTKASEVTVLTDDVTEL